MKKIYLIILFFVTVFVCSTSFAVPSPIEIDVQGIDGDIKYNVMEKLSAENQHTDFDTWYAQANEHIKEAMAPYGYFTPTIKRSVIQRDHTYFVRFLIIKGQQLIIRTIKIDINGNGKFNDEIIAAIKNMPLKPGAILQTVLYEKFKRDVLEVANTQGYLKSYWQTSNIRVNVARQQAVINLVLQTEKRYYFGIVYFHQTTDAYAPSFLKRFSLSAPRGYFSSKELVNYQQLLSTSPYFKEVNLTPNLSSPSTFIPLDARVTAPLAKKYTLGLGYSTWSGPRLLAGAVFRHLNNVGHYLETQLKLSSVISGVSAKYYIPGHNPLTQQWTLGANIQRFLPKNGSSSSSTLLAAYNIKNNNWQSNYALNYLVEQYKIQNANAQTSALIYPIINISHTNIDDPIYPAHGYNVNLMLRGAAKSIFSSTNFLQGSAYAKYLISIVDGTRFVARGSVGYTVVQDVSNLPLSLRFFTGGANSIRGYRDSSIGPGKYLLLGSLEIQQRVHNNWEMAIFFDQGKASNHLDSPWNKSTGVGVIYASIVGPVKLYVARDISLKKKPYRIEFSFGPEF